MNREQDDSDFGEPIETGIRSSDIGSFLPEGSYRPTPIVWLAGAWFLQMAALLVLFFLLLSKPAGFYVLTSALATLLIGRMTFARGMKHAGTGWCVFTVLFLFGFWVFPALIALAMQGIL